MSSEQTHKSRNGFLIAIGAAAFTATCAMAAPASFMSLALDNSRSNIAYRTVEGTIWNGKFTGLSVDGALAGDVEYTLSALSLLTLSPQFHLKSAGGAVRGVGVVRFGGGARIAITGADFDIDLGPFARQGVLGMPVQGEAQIKLDNVRIAKSGCRRAEGEIWTNVLEAPAKQYRMEGFPMSGDVKCDGADLVIALSGGGATGDAEMAIRVSPDLTYHITATARPTKEDVASALRYFGFEDSDGELVYGSAGVLRGAGT